LLFNFDIRWNFETLTEHLTVRQKVLFTRLILTENEYNY
jgi:hypothetical protein